VAETRKKNPKRANLSQQAKKRKRKSPARSGKRARKPSSRDFLQALLLTAAIIGVAVVISIVAIGIKTSPASEEIAETPALPPILAEEIPRVEDKPSPSESPSEIAAVTKAPPEKQTQAAPAPENKPEPAAVAVNKKPDQAPSPPPAARQPTATPPPVRNTPSEKTTTPLAPPLRASVPPELPPPPKHLGTLVFVIDDAGNNLEELEPFLRFPGPLTIAVLPGLPHSAEAARRIRAAGKEVFLHQPMEAIGGQNPGPGAIYSGMAANEIRAILRRNIAEIGPIAGMNNHQGSKITMDRQAMETVLAFCREQGICFLDSRTTAETAVPAAALNLGIKIGERNVFIDNEQDRPSMSRSIESGLTLASRRGNAVMIGHTWSPGLAPLLAELYQNFAAQGYTLATASSLIRN
jgi:polysaccharide deacetylase 2 family uncharacterized protein YibQ